MSQYFIIRFEDLKESKQEEIKRHLYTSIGAEDVGKHIENIGTGLTEAKGGIVEHFKNLIQRACDASWVEWEVKTNDI